MQAKEKFHNERNSRQEMYASYVMKPSDRICVKLDPYWGSRYEGQVAALTAVNLLSRMNCFLSLDIPKVTIVNSLPGAGSDLRDFLLHMAMDNDPYMRLETRRAMSSDFVIYLGPEGADYPITAYGYGWNATVGRKPHSLFNSALGTNPFGAAMASILAVSHVFQYYMCRCPIPDSVTINTYDWSHSLNNKPSLQPDPTIDLGNIWFIGLGSVGTAVVYFLTMFTRNFSGALIEGDVVENHNMDRAPLFSHKDEGRPKVEVVKEYLENLGMTGVLAESQYLNESKLWKGREAGVPDLIVPTANDYHVKPIIENSYPPLQMHATTGKHWQATLFRHRPLKDPCSCCAFPPSEESHVPMICAKGEIQDPSTDKKVDASLPFLSFSAGLMVAAEIAKLTLPSYLLSKDRSYIYFKETPRTFSASSERIEKCIYCDRSADLYKKTIEGSLYADLSFGNG